MQIHGYKAIALDLQRRINDREWELGQQIPGINSLQEQYGVRSLNVIRRAQAILIAKGLLRVERGRGAFVAGFGEQNREQLIDELDRASQELGAALKAWTTAAARLAAS